LEDQEIAQKFMLDQPVRTDSIRLTIVSVYPGEKWKDTVISDVEFLAEESR